MVEVGHRLWSAACRFTAVRNSHALSGCSGESPGSSQQNFIISGRPVREEATPGRRESLPATERGAAQNKTTELWTDRTESQHGRAGLCCVHGPAGQQFVLHQQVLAGRKTLWSRRAVSVNRDAFTYPHQGRLFSTVVFTLTDQGSERSRIPGRHPGLSAPCRSYTGKTDDAGPLYRSRTSYYDILRVTPEATQSQIKTAYYRESFIYHPDKNPGNKGAAERFFEVSEAYAVLGNVALRRKYDRGMLGPSDLRNPGRPSKETTGRSPGARQQQQQQRRAWQFSQTGGKVLFDFDAFYRAHYGEQLQREKILRARRKQMQEQQEKALRNWKMDRMVAMGTVLLLTMAGFLIVSVSKS